MNGLKILLSLSILMLAQSAFGQTIINPRKNGTGYTIGPYPVPVNYEDQSTVVYTWLTFTVVVEDRSDNPEYKLILTLQSQLNTLGELMQNHLKARLSQDNCGRINSADNWVYGMDAPEINVVSEHELNIKASGNISTWTCTEGVPETVCDSYTDSFGLSYPYNCRIRPVQYKFLNFEQGYTISKNIRFEAVNGEWRYKDYNPTIWFENNDVLNMIAFVGNNFGATFTNSIMQPERIKLVVPPEYRAFSPRYESGGFRIYSGVPYLYGSASASVSVARLNAFMAQYFGNLFSPVVDSGPTAPTPSMTKSLMQAECSKYDPTESIYECAAKYGFSYDQLPN